MRTIGVVTSARADYGIYLPVLKRIAKDPNLRLHLIVTGMHLSPAFGKTVQMIESDGFPIGDRIEMLLSSDSPYGISTSMGIGVCGFAQSLARCRPDILVVLGDRFEMFSAALSALPFKIPVAHLHGGEVTQGAIDDHLRHAMTKLSHLHFVSTQTYAQRVIQLGEEPWRVTVSGAPALDNLHELTLWDRKQLEDRYHLRLTPPPILVTYHPVTLEYEQIAWQINELLSALESSGLPVVFTMPNADTGHQTIMDEIKAFLHRNPLAQSVDNLGIQGYFSMMSIAQGMVGNSSSGLIEAPSFHLPVVNIGTRQAGRVRAENVIDVGYHRQDILAGIQNMIAPSFRDKLTDLVNPYGRGNAAEIIVERLKTVMLDEQLIAKKFFDLHGR